MRILYKQVFPSTVDLGIVSELEVQELRVSRTGFGTRCRGIWHIVLLGSA